MSSFVSRALESQYGDAEPIETLANRVLPAYLVLRVTHGRFASSLLLPFSILEPQSWSTLLTLPPPSGGGATDEGSLVLVRLVLGPQQVKAFVSLALDCLYYPFSQRQAPGAWLTTLNQTVLSANIPWDFDHSELEAKMIIPCLNPTRRKPSTGNLEEAMQLHADASVCHLERANLEQPETVVGKVVFLELTHTLPSCKAIVRKRSTAPAHAWMLLAHMGNHQHCHTNTRCPQKGISLLPDHHVLSASRRTNSKPRLTPFSLDFCFGLDSPSEIRTRLFGVLCLGLVLGLVGFGLVVLCLFLVPGSYLLSIPI